MVRVCGVGIVGLLVDYVLHFEVDWFAWFCIVCFWVLFLIVDFVVLLVYDLLWMLLW